MIRELVDYNLRRGSATLRSDVRHLLCLMSNNNTSATDELIEMLTRRVVNAVNGHLSNPDFVSSFHVLLTLLVIIIIVVVTKHLLSANIMCKFALSIPHFF